MTQLFPFVGAGLGAEITNSPPCPQGWSQRVWRALWTRVKPNASANPGYLRGREWRWGWEKLGYLALKADPRIRVHCCPRRTTSNQIFLSYSAGFFTASALVLILSKPQ